MADERKFALPDSMQFRAFYAQKRRRSRNSNIPIVVPITQNFINLLGDPPQAYYELATPWVAAGDFEFEIDYQLNELTNSHAFCGGTGNDLFRVDGASNTMLFRIGGNVYTSTGAYTEDLKLNTAKMVRTGGTVKVYRNNVEIDSRSIPVVDFDVEELGKRDIFDYFKGIISNVKLTDITTPANSLSFGLDNLTGDTEVNNGVTLNYRNISLDVRDTYTLTDGNWLGSEMVVNGDFATDTVWNKDAGWSISGGEAISIIQLSDLTQNGALLPSYNYRLKVDILAISGGVGLNIWNSMKLPIGSSVGSKSVDFLSNINRLTFYTDNAGITIDNVSVKRIIEVAQ